VSHSQAPASRGPTDAGLTARVLSSEWQPIETAPKDKTKILVGRFASTPPEKNGFMCVDWWRDSERDDVSYTGFSSFNPHHWPATHWMPLPTPPTNPTGAA